MGQTEGSRGFPPKITWFAKPLRPRLAFLPPQAHWDRGGLCSVCQGTQRISDPFRTKHTKKTTSFCAKGVFLSGEPTKQEMSTLDTFFLGPDIFFLKLDDVWSLFALRSDASVRTAAIQKLLGFNDSFKAGIAK